MPVDVQLLMTRQQKTVRTSYGGGGDAVFHNVPAIVNESSHAAPVSIYQFVNPMETEYSQNDSPSQRNNKVLEYDLHSLSPEPNCEVAVCLEQPK